MNYLNNTKGISRIADDFNHFINIWRISIMQFEIIPILSNFSDTEALLFEHELINKDNEYLTHAVIKVEGTYHWLVTEELGSQLKYHTDDNQIICPACKEELYVKGAYSDKIKTHLCHYPNQSNDCFFKKKYNSAGKQKCLEEGGKGGESEAHLQVKNQLEALIKTSRDFGHEVRLRRIKDYTITTDYTYQSYISYNYESVKLVNVEVEKQLVKKDGDKAGFRADLNVYDEYGNVYFIEVTYTNGKSLNSYYDLWRRGGSTVYEVKATTSKVNLIKSFGRDNYVISDEKNYIQKDLKGIEMRLLYDPVHHQGEDELMKVQKANAKLRKSFLWRELNPVITRARRRNGLFLKQNKTSQKWHHHKMKTEEFVQSNYYMINFKGHIFYEKIPHCVANYLNNISIHASLVKN